MRRIDLGDPSEYLRRRYAEILGIDVESLTNLAAVRRAYHDRVRGLMARDGGPAAGTLEEATLLAVAYDRVRRSLAVEPEAPPAVSLASPGRILPSPSPKPDREP